MAGRIDLTRLLALILLSGALALPALPVHADATDDFGQRILLEALTEIVEPTPAPGETTPLHFAAALDSSPSAIMALIEALCAPGLIKAIRGELERLRPATADPDARHEATGHTPLHFAAALDSNPSAITALIEGGADPDARGWDGVGTPLHGAAMLNSNPSVITALIEGGADSAGRMEGGMTPLHGAAMFNSNPSVVTALIEGGADPGARVWDGGMTPLHMAAVCNSNPSVVTALIEGGADPDAHAVDGMTPLHAAATVNSNPSVIMALIEGGADPGARNEAGRIPFDYAKENEALKGTDAYWLLYEARFE